MTIKPAPSSAARSPGFVAAHRAVNEVTAGRAVVLVDGAQRAVAAPLDGGVRVSGALAVSGPRAAFMGLGDAPVMLLKPEADSDQLWSLATAAVPDLAGVTVVRAGSFAAAATELAKLAERLPAMTVRMNAPEPAGALSASVGDVIDYRRVLASSFAPAATAAVPLKAGATATVTAFRNAVGGSVSTVVVGPVRQGMAVRVHSQCVTGDIFGSLKCDCGAQLQLALRRIAGDGGVLVYTAQEGRGIGLVNKLRAYALQDEGLDTVDANIALGYHDDERDYAAAARVLTHLGLTGVQLMTNNPAKAGGLRKEGISVAPVPLIGPVTAHNEAYLATKKARSGHKL